MSDDDWHTWAKKLDLCGTRFDISSDLLLTVFPSIFLFPRVLLQSLKKAPHFGSTADSRTWVQHELKDTHVSELDFRLDIYVILSIIVRRDSDERGDPVDASIW